MTDLLKFSTARPLGGASNSMPSLFAITIKEIHGRRRLPSVA